MGRNNARISPGFWLNNARISPDLISQRNLSPLFPPGILLAKGALTEFRPYFPRPLRDFAPISPCIFVAFFG
jgi:hypothetical protein